MKWPSSYALGTKKSLKDFRVPAIWRGMTKGDLVGVNEGLASILAPVEPGDEEELDAAENAR